MKHRRIRVLPLAGLVVAGGAWLGPMAGPAAAATSTEAVVTTDADTGNGSFREAIERANDTSLPVDEIYFDIAGARTHQIMLGSQLPAITSPVTIDGYTRQDGAVRANATRAADPRIVIDATGLRSGLRIKTDDTLVVGLVVRYSEDGYGIQVTGNDNVLNGDYVGVNGGGQQAEGNDGGIRINGDRNRVGGDKAAGRNVISGNAFDGVFVETGEDNEVTGNYIGVNEDGDTAVQNLGNGVRVGTGAERTVISGNVISGNNENGVLVDGNDTMVSDNAIGTDVSRTKKLGNGLMAGVEIDDGWRASITGNTISGNEADGVYLQDAVAAAVSGNFIGVAGDGTSPLGNGAQGVLVNVGAEADTITGNVIGDNGLAGIAADGADHVISGNTVGTGRLGNAQQGIQLGSSSDQILVEDNTVAKNGVDGIQVLGSNITLSRNETSGNGGLGINLDFDAVTANDPGDTDPGPNDLVNFPELTGATTTSTTSPTSVDWSFTDALPNASITLEFFSGTSCDASGNGEGAKYVGVDTATTDGNGDVVGTTAVDNVPVGRQISATATVSVPGVDRATSEYSACQVVVS